MTVLGEGKTDGRLESWKEIAVFFDRDEKTVRRWEKDLGLPVHRQPGISKGRVYAFAEELNAWSKRPRELKAEVSAQQETKPALLTFPVAPAENFLPGSSRIFRPIAILLTVVAALGVWLGVNFKRFSLTAFGSTSKPVSNQAASHPWNPEGERLYLEGRYYWNQRTAASLAKAIDDFTQAIVLDPQDAKAYAGLANAYNLIPEYSALPQEEGFARAIGAARRAIELDPNLAEAHRALAFPSFWLNYDAVTADREFKRAIALNPNDGTAHHWYANVLASVGENEKAVTEINRAQELDPSSSSVRADKGWVFYLAGRKEEAVALLQQMKKNEPTFVSPYRYLAQVYFHEANYPDYLREAEQAARLVNRPDEKMIVEAEKTGFARAGIRGLLEGRLEAEKKLYQQEKIPIYSLAQTSAMLGNKADALQYLTTSRDRHEKVIALLRVDTALRSLRDEPTYQQMASEMAFPPLNR